MAVRVQENEPHDARVFETLAQMTQNPSVGLKVKYSTRKTVTAKLAPSLSFEIFWGKMIDLMPGVNYSRVPLAALRTYSGSWIWPRSIRKEPFARLRGRGLVAATAYWTKPLDQGTSEFRGKTQVHGPTECQAH